MINELQKLFNMYRQNHPYCAREDVVSLMLNDGVISSDIAEKIKSGTSLFLLDNDFSKPVKSDIFSMTKFSDEDYTETKTSLKINQKIEPTFQSESQGDCWLLSDINALNQTDWGKKIIHDAIVPDEDGGGVTVKFPGSPLSQTDFHISEKEIEEAKKSGHYSTGDDDMLALELAVEKISKIAVNAGFAKRVDDFDDVIGYPSYLTNILLDEDKEIYLEISQLLTGRSRVSAAFVAYSSNGYDKKSMNNYLKYISNNQNKVAAVCTFDHYKDLFGQRAEDDVVHGSHAYAIKRLTYGKEVVVIDPYHADEEIKIPWKKFIDDVETIFAEGEDDKTNEELKQALPKDYDEVIRKDREERKLTLKNINEEIKALQEKEKLFVINRKFDEIMNSYSWKMLESNNKIAFDDVKTNMEKIDKDTVLKVLDAKPNLIIKLDKYMSGWGSGKNKKEIIIPIINALIEKASEVGIDKNIINDFNNSCVKELDAWFYTNGEVIQREVEKMVKLITQKS